MKADTEVPGAFAILTRAPSGGGVIRFSIGDNSAEEKPVFSASCWRDTPTSSRNCRIWSPTCTSGSPAAGPQSPDSSAILESRSSNDSSRVMSGQGFSILQGVDVERDELLVFFRDDLW